MARSVQYNNLKDLLRRAAETAPEPLKSEIAAALTRKPGQPQTIDREAVRRMRNDKIPAQQIADSLGCSVWSVYKIK